MVVADSHGLPLAADTVSASPHEVTLVRGVLAQGFTTEQPERLIGNKAMTATRSTLNSWSAASSDRAAQAEPGQSPDPRRQGVAPLSLSLESRTA